MSFIERIQNRNVSKSTAKNLPYFHLGLLWYGFRDWQGWI